VRATQSDRHFTMPKRVAIKRGSDRDSYARNYKHILKNIVFRILNKEFLLPTRINELRMSV